MLVDSIEKRKLVILHGFFCGHQVPDLDSEVSLNELLHISFIPVFHHTVTHFELKCQISLQNEIVVEN